MPIQERIEKAREVALMKSVWYVRGQEAEFAPTKRKLVQMLRDEGFDDEMFSMVRRIWHDEKDRPYVVLLPTGSYHPVTVTLRPSDDLGTKWTVTGGWSKLVGRIEEGKLLDAVIERMASVEEELPGYVDVV